MTKRVSCALLLIVAVLLELVTAIAGTIVANQTNKMGLGYVVLIVCLAIITLLGRCWDRRLALLVRVGLILVSLPVSLFLYELVLIPILRKLPFLK